MLSCVRELNSCHGSPHREPAPKRCPRPWAQPAPVPHRHGGCHEFAGAQRQPDTTRPTLGVPLLSSPGRQCPAPAHPGVPACRTHGEMPIGFTAGCPVPPVPRVGTVTLNARRVVRRGRSSWRLPNLILLSDLQQRWLARAALIPAPLIPTPLIPAPLIPGIGAPQSRCGAAGPNPAAARLPSKPQTPWGRGVPMGTTAAPGEGFGTELVAAPQQPSCGFRGA